MHKGFGKIRFHLSAGLILLGLLAGACTERDRGGESVTGSAPQTNTAVAQTAAAVAPAARPQQNQGVVRSVKIGGGYSYIEVDLGDSHAWVATAITSVSPGDRIAWKNHAVMTNFTSKALNRTFDQILFVDRVARLSADADKQRRGVVAETMTAAGYSFIRVEENGSSVWLAAPQTTIEVGQAIEWSGGSTMRNFNSRSLQRTFDEIIFVGSVHLS